MARIKYDIERIIDDIEVLLKAKLSAKIDEIEAQKTAEGKPVGLPHIDDKAYTQQTWSVKMLQYKVAIFYGLAEVQSQGANSATLENYKIFVEVVLVDGGNDSFGLPRIHRYTRALKEVFEENFDELPWGNKSNIETVLPISFKLEEDSSEDIRVGGVSIVTSLM